MVDWHNILYGESKGAPVKKKEWWQYLGDWVNDRNKKDQVPYRGPAAASTSRRGGGGSFAPKVAPKSGPNTLRGTNDYYGISDRLRKQALDQQGINVPLPDWDPNAMAASEFDPQLQALLAARTELESRTARNKDVIGQLFGSLATGIRGDSSKIDSIYDTAGANTGNIYDQAIQSVASTYDRNAAEQEAMLRRLGIEEAAPAALQQGTEDESFFTGLLNNNKANNLSLLDTLQGNAQVANTGYAQAAELGGANRQADLVAQLQQYLSQNDQQRMTLEGQKAGRASELARQLEQTNYDRGMDSYNLNRQSMMDQMSLQEQQQKALAASQPSFDQQWKTMSPTEKVMYKADEITGGQADVYYNFIRNVIDNDPNILTGRPSASEFSRRVRAANSSGRLNSAYLDNLARYMIDVRAV